MRFVHAADCHLGYHQYGSDERRKDFARAFLWLAQEAIAQKADCLLLAGDLFHSQAMTPETLMQATIILDEVKDAGIKVLAVTGNHDRARHSDGRNWLHALEEFGYLKLLDIRIEGGHLSKGSSATYEGPDWRVVGIPYLGAALSHLLSQIVEQLAMLPRKFTILMLHAGIEGVLDRFSGALSMADLAPLRPLVDYLALGHIHKPFHHYGWVYNPGSLETCSIDEAQWDQRGYLVSETTVGAKVTRVPYSGRRSFVQGAWKVGAYETSDSLCAALDAALAEEQIWLSVKPVVEMRLEGALQFPRAQLALSRIEKIVRDAYNPIVCRIRDVTESNGAEIAVGESASRIELERDVVQQLVARDPGREPQAKTWVQTILEIRDLALRRSDPETIIKQARRFQRLPKETATC